MTINGQHVITDALRYCGARNVFAGAKGLTPTVALQQVLREKPDVIVIAQSTHEPELNAQWHPMLNAFPKTNKPVVISVNGDSFHQPGPGLIGETIKLCAALKAL
jgi:iron complex transport system substrate-binding protein